MRSISTLYSCLCFGFWSIAQELPLKFTYLSLEQGLSQSSVSCIYKDSRGFMWFGTEDGLNKYDGQKFTVYRPKPDDNTSISSGNISAIVEQEDGHLWIGTANGLNHFDPDYETFTRYLHDPNNPKSIGHNEISSLSVASNGILLIGTGNGLGSFHETDGFRSYSPKGSKAPYRVFSIVQSNDGDAWVLSSRLLERIQIDDDAHITSLSQQTLKKSTKGSLLLDTAYLWIGTDKGLMRYTPETKTVEHFDFPTSNTPTEVNYDILSLIHSDANSLWIGTNYNGLLHFDKRAQQFTTVAHHSIFDNGLNSKSARSLFKDKTGILWVGTYGHGINKHDPHQFKFEHYHNTSSIEKRISDNTVRALFLDSDSLLWVGTHGGLNQINRKTGFTKVYTHDPDQPSSISSNTIRSLCEVPKGTLWAGSWLNGLNRFDKKTGTFERIMTLPGQTDSISQVRTLAADPQENLWIGGYGLWKYNPKTHQSKGFFHDANNSNSLSHNSINRLFFDYKGALWIATQDGLNRLDTTTDSIKQYPYNPLDKNGLSHKYVTSIAEDQRGNLWIGTYGGGLNKFNPQNGIFEHFDTSNGLLNDVVYGVLIDKQGFVWFTSNAGLGRLNTNSLSFKYYGVDQGIQSNEFNAGAYFKNRDEFFFGGINGFNVFRPSLINDFDTASKIVFTDFYLLDTEKTHPFTRHISRMDTISLAYNQNNFAFEFAELDYAENPHKSYAYQLEGFDVHWKDLNQNTQVQLGNMPPGAYRLTVKNQDHPLQNASIHILISPPSWKTPWAYSLYILLILTFIFLMYRSHLKRKSVREQFELKIKALETNANLSSQIGDSKIPFPLPFQDKNIGPINQKFLERALEIVETHIADSHFNVETFAYEMHVSRSQLHRKLKTLTGCSATKFIRLIRLKKAAQLLLQNEGNVGEIAYQVGFENIGYFSKCFHETFGTPPSQYPA